jgi:teichuronopeptide biosynthesis TupA-like protein
LGWAEVFEWRRIADWYGAIRRVRAAYRAHFQRAPRLLRPQLFSEKMQWRKLFDLDPRYAILSDKVAARDYIAGAIGPDYLPPLLLVADDADAIAFEALDPPCILKSTHGFNQVLRVPVAPIDVAATRAMLKSWLAWRHGALADEPGYVHVPPRIIVERLLRNRDGSAPVERRLFVFGGRVRATQTVVVENGALRAAAFHDRDWRRLPWRGDTEPHPGPFPRPARYDELVTLAERLGRGFDHVRVDLYDADDRVWAGELTLYSWSGLGHFTTEEPDRVLGSYWTIERPMWRALGALLARRREIRQPVNPSPASGEG